jgi:hypothetical protein
MSRRGRGDLAAWRWRLDPTAAIAARACLLPQPTMLRHLTLALHSGQSVLAGCSSWALVASNCSWDMCA